MAFFTSNIIHVRAYPLCLQDTKGRCGARCNFTLLERQEGTRKRRFTRTEGWPRGHRGVRFLRLKWFLVSCLFIGDGAQAPVRRLDHGKRNLSFWASRRYCRRRRVQVSGLLAWTSTTSVRCWTGFTRVGEGRGGGKQRNLYCGPHPSFALVNQVCTWYSGGELE